MELESTTMLTQAQEEFNENSTPSEQLFDTSADDISFSFTPDRIGLSTSPPSSPHSSLNSSSRSKPTAVDVILPDATLKQIEVDPRCNGYECLEKILSLIAIFEELDYFGLLYYGAKQEPLWVNLRNRLLKQMSGSPTGICRLYLRVKFFVQPHMVLQDETRHLMYLDVNRTIRDEPHYTEELSDFQRAELIAYLAQADFGDFVVATTPIKYQKFWKSDSGPIPDEMIAQIAEIHRTLVGLPRLAAEGQVMRLTSKLSMYGMHLHEAKDCFENKINIAVGPTGICLCRESKQITDRYPYPRVQKVTISDRVLYLSLSAENGNVKEVGYRLVSQRAANGLYRCVTEMHSFFRCDTVRTDVSTQTCRDLKGTLVAFFIEHEGGIARDFVFDIRRTAREVYDDSRRKLHVSSSAANTPTISSSDSTAFPFDIDDCCGELCRGGKQSSNKLDKQSSSEMVVKLQLRVESLEQSRKCSVCMEGIISVVFTPCGHLVCCPECSNKLSNCPVCRTSIANKQIIYAPWTS